MFLHNCANAIWSLKGPKGFPFFFFFLTKNFNHIAKDASILNFKLGGSHGLNYLGKSRLHYPFFDVIR